MYWITGILGLLFISAPYLLGYQANQLALWTSLLLGGAIVIFSYLERRDKDKSQWEYVASEIAGLAAIVAPFALGFSNHPTAMLTSVSAGLLLTAIVALRLYRDQAVYM